jgi:SEC-C motif-containing protein
MRSRYTAFVRGDMAYLENTLVPRKRSRFDARKARAFNADVVWTGLSVLAASQGGMGTRRAWWSLRQIGRASCRERV